MDEAAFSKSPLSRGFLFIYDHRSGCDSPSERIPLFFSTRGIGPDGDPCLEVLSGRCENLHKPAGRADADAGRGSGTFPVALSAGSECRRVSPLAKRG